MKAKTLILNLICHELRSIGADKLRGYFANKYGEYELIHQHLNDDKLVYQSPLVSCHAFNVG